MIKLIKIKKPGERYSIIDTNKITAYDVGYLGEVCKKHYSVVTIKTIDGRREIIISIKGVPLDVCKKIEDFLIYPKDYMASILVLEDHELA